MGDRQVHQPFRQSVLHWNCEPFSVERNLNRALRELVVVGGALVMRVFGGFRPILARSPGT